MEKTLDELKFVIAQRQKDFPPEKARAEEESKGEDFKPDDGKVLAICLSSRRNMCINDKVANLDSREKVDSKCRELTASWVRNPEGL